MVFDPPRGPPDDEFRRIFGVPQWVTKFDYLPEHTKRLLTSLSEDDTDRLKRMLDEHEKREHIVGFLKVVAVASGAVVTAIAAAASVPGDVWSFILRVFR